MKSKIKKVLVSIHLFFVGIVSKVFAVSTNDINTHFQTDYGIEISPIEKGVRLGKLILPVILFVIGLFVILSEKITKKVKAILISVLVLLGILGYVFMNYISTNL